MKKLLIISIIIVTALLITPVVFGFYFKKSFISNIQTYSGISQNDSDESNIDGSMSGFGEDYSKMRNPIIKLVYYNEGWFSSTAVIEVQFNSYTGRVSDNVLTMAFYIHSTIYHGPIVKTNNQWSIGLASIKSTLIPSDLFNYYLSNFFNRKMELSTLVQINQNAPITYFVITSNPTKTDLAPHTPDFDAASGKINIVTKNRTLDSVKTDISIDRIKQGCRGSVLCTSYSLESLKTTWDAIKTPDNIWDSEISYDVGRFNLHVIEDKGSYNADHISGALSFKTKNAKSDINFNTIISRLDIPTDNDLIANLSNINFQCQLSNVSLRSNSGYLSINLLTDAFELFEAPISKLQAISAVKLKLSFNTNLGALSADLSLAANHDINADNAYDLLKKYDGNINLRSSHQLPDALLNKYVKYFLTRKTCFQHFNDDEMKIITSGIVSELVQKNYLKNDNDGYVLTITKTGTTLTINGISAELENVIGDIQQITTLLNSKCEGRS